MTILGTSQRPLRVGIIGSGPSGFYCADALFKSDKHIHVDMFDRLPTPFGLLRGGVAPDHQKMKSVGAYYHRVATKNSEQFSFFGNVTIGKDISVEELSQYYDALIFCYGAETDRKLYIDGEDLNGSYTATEFVGWYNGHPDYVDCHFDLNQSTVSIIGLGNVAIDVARILAKMPEKLNDSDIAQHAFDQLIKSQLKEIHLIGRRGPVQAAFTELEMEELGNLEDCDIVINPDDLVLTQTDEDELALPDKNKARKNIEVLKQLSQKPFQGKSKKIILHFLRSPVEFNGTSSVESITLEKNILSGEPGNQTASGTGEMENFNTDLVFRSVGYKGVKMPGLPFDEKRGVIPNNKGRVLDEGVVVNGKYVAGWIKRGAIGVLGSNKPGGTETVSCVLEDLDKLKRATIPDSGALIQLFKTRHIRYISYAEWELIDQEEIRRGGLVGKPREKFVSIEDMLTFINGVEDSKTK